MTSEALKEALELANKYLEKMQDRLGLSQEGVNILANALLELNEAHEKLLAANADLLGSLRDLAGRNKDDCGCEPGNEMNPEFICGLHSILCTAHPGQKILDRMKKMEVVVAAARKCGFSLIHQSGYGFDDLNQALEDLDAEDSWG